MKRTKLICLPLLVSVTSSAQAASFELASGSKFEISGFTKHEWGRSYSPVHVLTNEQSNWTFDNRNALSKPDVADVGLANRNSETSLQGLSVGATHETAGAVNLEARITYRWRSDKAYKVFDAPDVDYVAGTGTLWKTDFFEKFAGISRPDLGSLRLGTLVSRTWSRSDSFSYPIGLSGAWADSGASYAILPTAIQLTSPMWTDGSGKLTAELTLATNKKNTTYSASATTPKAAELFLQFSNSKNLIELSLQSTSGAKQTAFGKAALVGWIGDTDSFDGAARNAGKPSQSVVSLQGNHWPNPQNMFTWGVRRSQWSGSAATCNWNGSYCLFGIEPGFNYGPASTNYVGYRARTVDAMLGWSHYRGLYTYTIGGVYFGRASSDNPAEWGQSNSALLLNVGVSRKVPEVHKGLTVSAGMSFSQFEKIGPAPVSMPNNNFLGVNPLYRKRGHGAAVGLTWVF